MSVVVGSCPSQITNFTTHRAALLRSRSPKRCKCSSDIISETPANQAEPQGEKLRLKASLVTSIEKVGKAQWDACHDNSNPFVSYDFLHAVEASGSAMPDTGWLPQHLVLTSEPSEPTAVEIEGGGRGQAQEDSSSSVQNEILACVPLYLKSHSYGEYVFDSGWAEAYDNSMYGVSKKRYYPKLQSCVPFTPVTGPRVLVRPGNPSTNTQVAAAISRTLRSLPDELGVSGVHVTFNSDEERRLMEAQGFLTRVGVQYWWHNHVEEEESEMKRQYTSFDDFLAALQQKRRKAIRQERKKVAAEGLRIRRLTGDDLRDSSLWDAFYGFYCNTVGRKWGVNYLTREFFAMVSETMADKIVLVVADGDKYGARPVAAALNFVGTDALYGRNWGCAAGDSIKGLHFELCFYQAIEHAIECGLHRVEAGAQGEHKVARGYLPSLTYSSHYIEDPGFSDAVRSFLRREKAQLEDYAEALTAEASPYKK